MPSYDSSDDVFSGSGSQFLSPTKGGTRRSPSRHSVKSKASNSGLRGASSLADAMDDDAANGRQHSLAHELAAALLPEPSASSRLLAEEFGIEYDEGAEGIDEDSTVRPTGEAQLAFADETRQRQSIADELGSEAADISFHASPDRPATDRNAEDLDPFFGSPSISRQKKPQRLEQDAMEVLSQDLESTDKFLQHLRHLDADAGPHSISQPQPALEKIASEVIRRLNDSTRDREGQVRELLEYEREFRKIAGEVGGNDVLGHLEELSGIEELSEVATTAVGASSLQRTRTLDVLEEEDSRVNDTQDWEVDPDRHTQLGEELDDDHSDLGSEMSPVKESFPQPPPVVGPPTPATTIPHLAHLRSFTTSLVSSLTTISEQAQVNGAATTEAGRKIRALKNKLGGWRTDWDSAERSRERIERWEAGIIDGATPIDGPTTPVKSAASKRVDGRLVVQEHLQAFEKALAEAGAKTQSIMAAS